MALYLGIDSGGTRVRASIARSAASGAAPQVLATAEGPSIKLLHVPAAVAEARLDALLAELSASAGISLGDVAATCAGLSGYGAEWVRAQTLALMRARIGGQVTVCGDEQIALAAAQQGHNAQTPLVLLIAGTGSHAIMVSPGRTAHAGGWGPALGDEGGGTWLGRQAIRASLRALDESGRAERPPLLDALLRAWDLAGIPELVTHAHAPGADFATLVPAIAAAARAGDALAASLLARAGQELARLAAVTAARLDGVTRVAWTGSILRELAMVRYAMREDLQQRGVLCNIDDEETDPLLGALHLAAESHRQTS